ncbi:MAG: hypothetical protein KDB18_13835, partial [Salinibacterium sp.]|nr:hypothetical protein [Salinibacterium sp.]
MKNKAGGYSRTILRGLRLGEISAVDNPAQEHATLTIVKRADDVAPVEISDEFAKASFEEALRQIKTEEAMAEAFSRFWRLNDALRTAIKQILMDPKEQNPIQAVRAAAQAYVEKIEGMARAAVQAVLGAQADVNDDAYKAAVEKAIESGAVDAEFVKAHVAGSTGSRTQEESMDKKEQEALEKRAADAEARAQKAEAIAGMTPAVRKYYDGLAEAAQTEFLKKD